MNSFRFVHLIVPIYVYEMLCTLAASDKIVYEFNLSMHIPFHRDRCNDDAYDDDLAAAAAVAENGLP